MPWRAFCVSEAVGDGEVDVAGRAGEGAELVVAAHPVGAVEHVVKIGLHLQVTEAVVEGGVVILEYISFCVKYQNGRKITQKEVHHRTTRW